MVDEYILSQTQRYLLAAPCVRRPGAQGAVPPIAATVSIKRWFKRHEQAIDKVQVFIGESKAPNMPDLAMLSAALRKIRKHLLAG